MRLFQSAFFLTLVVSLGTGLSTLGASKSDVKTEFGNSKTPESNNPVQNQVMDSTQVTDTLELKTSAFKNNADSPGFTQRIRLKSATAFYFGTLAGRIAVDTEINSPFVAAASWEQYADLDLATEYSCILTTPGLVGVFAGRKYFVMTDTYREPFWKIAAGAFLDARDGVSGIVNFQRYQMQLALGLEDLLKMGRQTRLETGLSYGLSGMNYYLLMGYSFR